MTTTFSITGMSCQHCIQAVRRALAAVPGVTVVDVSLGTATVTIDTDDGMTMIDRALSGAGYQRRPDEHAS